MPVCNRCGTTHSRDVRAKYCTPCNQYRTKVKNSACARVNNAIVWDRLPRASTLDCVDCGKQAQQYDHRDYDYPLAVEPVCIPCNRKRGPAKQMTAVMV